MRGKSLHDGDVGMRVPMKAFQILSLVITFLLYTGYTAAAYMPTVRNSAKLFIIGILCANTAHLLWMLNTRLLANSRLIFFYGLSWDLLVTVASFLVPILFFSVRFQLVGYIGLGMIFCGLFLVKISMGLTQ
jgi:drug/metabolite transporter (DMT)-like permease